MATSYQLNKDKTISKARFKAWLAARPADFKFYDGCASESCPISRYLQDVLGDGHLTTAKGSIGSNRLGIPYRQGSLGSWVYSFQNQADLSAGQINPSQAIAILERV